MIQRQVRFTETARKQVRDLKIWWRENSREPEIVDHDLGERIKTLSLLPGIGTVYPNAPINGLRRLYLERLMSHLYYTYDEREIVIRALWHTRRGSRPDFGPF